MVNHHFIFLLFSSPSTSSGYSHTCPTPLTHVSHLSHQPSSHRCIQPNRSPRFLHIPIPILIPILQPSFSSFSSSSSYPLQPDRIQHHAPLSLRCTTHNPHLQLHLHLSPFPPVPHPAIPKPPDQTSCVHVSMYCTPYASIAGAPSITIHNYLQAPDLSARQFSTPDSLVRFGFRSLGRGQSRAGYCT